MGEGSNTVQVSLYTLYTIYILHTLCTISILSASLTLGKREKGIQRETGKGGAVFWVRIPLGNQTARTQARTNETKGNDFPAGLAPNLRFKKHEMGNR